MITRIPRDIRDELNVIAGDITDARDTKARADGHDVDMSPAGRAHRRKKAYSVIAVAWENGWIELPEGDN